MRKSIALSILLVLATWVWASNPTVTRDSNSPLRRTDVTVYTYSFTTAIANVDTAIILRDITNTKNWYIGYMGGESNTQNQVVTVNLHTDETTADSVRVTLLHQVSYKADPATAIFGNDDWTNVSTVVDTNAVSFYQEFDPVSTGRPFWYRLLIFENDTNKDASQTFTLDLTFPTVKRNRDIVPSP